MSLVETALPGLGLGDWRRDTRRENIQFCVGERAEVRRVAGELFGPAVTSRHFAGLAGAPDGAEVEVGVCQGNLTIEISDPQHRIYRGVSRVFRTADGLVLTIEALHIHRPSMRGRGLGLAIFARQLQTARMLGIVRIETRAGRRCGENGYYSWPRYGFDGRLPRWLVSRQPPEFCSAQSVLDLMASQRGRQWWLAHGFTLDVVFDVHKASRSSQTLRRYLPQSRQAVRTSQAVWPAR